MLTKKQELCLCRKFKTPHSLLEVLKTFGISTSIEDIEKVWTKQYVENLKKQSRREWFRKTQTWEIINRYTPIYIDDTFITPVNPVIGRSYHLSWAFKWARFILKKIEGETVYLDNPKHKRDTLLKAKKSDLRLTRWAEFNRQDELIQSE